MAEEKSFKYVIVGGGVAAVLRGSGNLRIHYSMAEKRQSALIVSRNGDGRELDDLDESEIERIGGKHEDEEELIEGHHISSSYPERWDVLGLGQAMVCEKSLTSATGGPNSPLSSSFVRAKMVSSGFLIRPCDGGGSIIHIFDHVDLDVSSVPEVLRPLYESSKILAQKMTVAALRHVRQIAQETSGEGQYSGGRQSAVLRTFSQRLCRGFSDAVNGFADDGWSPMSSDGA